VILIYKEKDNEKGSVDEGFAGLRSVFDDTMTKLATSLDERQREIEIAEERWAKGTPILYLR
jgi:hypothetical protein